MADSLSGLSPGLTNPAPIAADASVVQLLDLLQSLQGTGQTGQPGPESPDFLTGMQGVVDLYSAAGLGLQESVSQGFDGMVGQVIGLGGGADPFLSQTGSLMRRLAANPALLKQLSAAPSAVQGPAAAGAAPLSLPIYQPDSGVISTDRIFDPGADLTGPDNADG